MRIYSIYRATNTITGKVYIGFDSSWPRRIVHHRSSLLHGKKGKIYSAMMKYGWDKFTWDVIYQAKEDVKPGDSHTLNVMESIFIKEYDSINNGYNINHGGRGCSGATKDTIWITDGTKHQRIYNNGPLPIGWRIGRVSKQTKTKQLMDAWKAIGLANKGKRVYGNNPAARKIQYKDIIYSSIKEAAETNNTTVYFIKKYGTFIP